MKSDSGQAMIILIFVSTIVVYWTIQAVALNLSALTVTGEGTTGQILLARAEGYLENAIIRYLRNPSYNGEIITSPDCEITTAVVGLDKEITSTCRENGRQKTVGVTISFASGIYTFSKIMEK